MKYSPVIGIHALSLVLNNKRWEPVVYDWSSRCMGLEPHHLIIWARYMVQRPAHTYTSIQITISDSTRIF